MPDRCTVDPVEPPLNSWQRADQDKRNRQKKNRLGTNQLTQERPSSLTIRLTALPHQRVSRRHDSDRQRPEVAFRNAKPHVSLAMSRLHFPTMPTPLSVRIGCDVQLLQAGKRDLPTRSRGLAPEQRPGGARTLRRAVRGNRRLPRRPLGHVPPPRPVGSRRGLIGRPIASGPDERR